jgi:hypothetical protein
MPSSNSSELVSNSTEGNQKSTSHLSEIDTTKNKNGVTVGYNAALKANFDGSIHQFESAHWVLNDIVEPVSPDDTLAGKKLSAKKIEKRKSVRAKTLDVVMSVLLRYMGPVRFQLRWQLTLHIAGYPELGTHALPDEYIDTVSLRRIMEAPVNLETLVARLFVATSESEKRFIGAKRVQYGKEPLISKSDALCWRRDSHLSHFKVPCVFKRNALVNEITEKSNR